MMRPKPVQPKIPYSPQKSTTLPETDNSKASVTAVCVAWGFARAVVQSGGQFFPIKEAKLTEHLCDIGRNSLTGLNYILAKILSLLPYSVQSGFFNKAVVPGYDQVMLLRKLMIKTKIDTAIKNGVTQIVFLRGGYDIRGLVTALENPGVDVYEVDHGKTRDCKLLGLSSVYLQTDYQFRISSSLHGRTTYINNNMNYIDHNLAENNLRQVLLQEGFVPDAPTLIVAEACTMYLDVDANARLLQFAGSLPNPLNEMLFSYYSHSKYSYLSQTSQAKTNELYQFCASREQAFQFVQDNGCMATEQCTPSQFLSDLGCHEAARYYANHPMHPVEFYLSLRSAQHAHTQHLHIDDVPTMRYEQIVDDLVLQSRQDTASAAATPLSLTSR